MNTDIIVGSEVVFGRHNGEQTKGIVIKVNQKTFKIRTTEERYGNRVRNAGCIYNVAKSLVSLAGAKVTMTGYSQPVKSNYTVKQNIQVGDTVSLKVKSTLVSTKVIRVNRKTVSTENGYRVPFGLLVK